ncbi:hypothetical protein [Streptomyces europaeiscabiei]|uniref:hypothetical protein n=1 Tax=Streptomyces europaeiscabiei TaxID=146819 RepID=UPI002E188EE7
MRYARLVDHYRERWTRCGCAPKDAVVAAGLPSLLVADTSQKALELFRSVWEVFAASPTFKHNKSEITTAEDLTRAGVSVGSTTESRTRSSAAPSTRASSISSSGIDQRPDHRQHEHHRDLDQAETITLHTPDRKRGFVKVCL